MSFDFGEFNSIYNHDNRELIELQEVFENFDCATELNEFHYIFPV